MTRGLLFSFLFHSLVIFITMLTLPFMMREPIDLPPIVSVELIEINDKTFIHYAPKARKIIEKVKDENKSVVSEQAPPLLKPRKNQIEFQCQKIKKKLKNYKKETKSRGD